MSTKLHEAVFEKNVNKLKNLLLADYDVNEKDKYGKF